jgi:predicted RNA-binding protein with PUA-like domain
MNYWLFKSEPDAFSIDDLRAMPGKKDHWDGIRNYQARNMMRDDMKKGDLGFFYHSSCAVPGIVGIVEIVKEAYDDHTALDKKSRYFDPKATPENPRWCMVDVKFKKKFKSVLSLEELKKQKKLASMTLLKKGNRLSIMPVDAKHWNTILSLIE